jgi:hypothetical protein
LSVDKDVGRRLRCNDFEREAPGSTAIVEVVTVNSAIANVGSKVDELVVNMVTQELRDVGIRIGLVVGG